MDRSEAFQQVEALLEAEGRDDLLGALRRALHTLESYEAHGKTIAEVTRALLESDKTYRLVFSHELDPVSLFDPATGSFLHRGERRAGADAEGDPRPACRRDPARSCVTSRNESAPSARSRARRRATAHRIASSPRPEAP